MGTLDSNALSRCSFVRRILGSSRTVLSSWLLWRFEMSFAKLVFLVVVIVIWINLLLISILVVQPNNHQIKIKDPLFLAFRDRREQPETLTPYVL
jgi:hypothetical protein